MKVRLKHRRLARELAKSGRSQNAWAMRLGLGKGHLSNLANGRHPYPHARTRRKLMRGLGLGFEELFEIEEAPAGNFRRNLGSPGGNRWSYSEAEGANMESWMQDFRYALRGLRLSPGFSLVALLALALGIGANTAIFSLVHSVLLKPLPYEDPERIVTLWQDNRLEGDSHEEASPANFRDWRERSETLEHICVAEPYGLDYFAGQQPRSFPAGRVSKGFFKVLGVTPLHGRIFLEEEYEAGREKVAILSHRVWQDHFGADPDIVGRVLPLDGEPWQVVGVMPPGFRPRLFGVERVLWIPRVDRESDYDYRAATYLNVLARLKPGVTLEQAQAEMDAIGEQLEREYPRANARVGVRVIPMVEDLVAQSRPMLVTLLAAVGFVLLIACANLANLLLARNASRRRGLAIRSTLGAGRLRLLRQLMMENLLLGLAGGAAGVALAWWLIKALIALSPEGVPRLEQAGLDVPVLLFALAAALGTALLFGSVPAWRFSRPDIREAFQDDTPTASSGPSASRGRGFLVAAEVALALVLLVGAGLMIRSFATLVGVDPGFALDRVLALQIFISDRYSTGEERAGFYRDSLQRIQGLPGVRQAGLVSALPLSHGKLVPHNIDPAFSIEGHPELPPDERPVAGMTTATPGYFQAMDIPVLSGRMFDSRDNAQAEVRSALINETFAKRHFPEENPVGKRLNISYGRGFQADIVGIVGDVRHYGMDREPDPEFYLHLPQFPFYAMTYVVRTQGDPAALQKSVQQAIWDINPAQTIYAAATMEQLYSDSIASRRFGLALLTAFAALALGLAAMGIYGVLSFNVRRRTREIGIRRALGAQSSDLLSEVLSQGLRFALLGTTAGLAAAWGLTRFLESLLYEVSPTDPWTFAVIAALVLTISAAASYFPARRAVRVDPMTALRYE